MGTGCTNLYTYLFFHAVGPKNLVTHYCENGLIPCTHGNNQDIVQFILLRFTLCCYLGEVLDMVMIRPCFS